ncbi:peroxidase 5 [Beta vulgaris subsp. vulgaris]|uniref:peroxidase 5 n=1 Tax=Beta vulgaris subsp. vulgaris TaxID=3555 RepID=UPI002036743E|nr:peroxidase 5 [Beta vulgaris subsp. vulgaris]
MGQTNNNNNDINITTAAISDRLSLYFYKSTCPRVEQIIEDVIRNQSQKNPGIIPGIMRLHFHDCYITGCDASILLTPQRYNSYNAEMSHPANGKSLRGMDALEAAKAELEKQCPGVVSCADILAYAARDVVMLSGSPKYEVPAGRRDSFCSDGTLAGALPKANDTLATLQKGFAARGLTLEDMVVLEGSHSIGQTRCLNTIADTGSMTRLLDVESLVDKPFQSMIKQKFCPESQKRVFWNLTAPLTPEKPDNSAWGNSFYQLILKGKSLLPSDIALAVDPSTKEMVERFAYDNANWQNVFNEAMIKLGKVNVLTGDQGEIRRQCGWINAVNTA